MTDPTTTNSTHQKAATHCAAPDLMAAPEVLYSECDNKQQR
jgi:hypothetical protein